jgi:protein-S-isoprenylcysteine O-methyltransferase Ste14
MATFGWPTLRALRTSGQSQWREPVSRTDAIGETICLVGCLVTLAAPVMAIVGLAGPLGLEWEVARALASIALIGLGTGLAVWAQRHLAEEWRAGVEASAFLVTGGPFARVRNPFYVGCFLASAAVVVAVPSAVAVVGLTMHIVAAEIIVRGVEEPILSQAHGAEFLRYKQRTGRFLPRL